MISRFRASCWAIAAGSDDPVASSCLSASFSVSSFSFVSLIALPRSSCFCRRSSVLPGSIFSSLLTSFSWLWVSFRDLSTPRSASCSFVVSPLISMVMPLMFPAMLSSLESIHIFLRCHDRIFNIIVAFLSEDIKHHTHVQIIKVGHTQPYLSAAQKIKRGRELPRGWSYFFLLFSSCCWLIPHRVRISPHALITSNGSNSSSQSTYSGRSGSACLAIV